MIKILIRLFITIVALKAADYFLDSLSLHGGFFSLFWLSVVLGILNWIVKPVLVFFSVPFLVLTAGFFYLIVNALILYAASELMPGVISATTFGIFWGSLLVSILHWLLTILFRVRRKSS